MKVRLAYGRSGLEVELPDGLQVDIVRPKHVEAVADQAEAVRDALRHPMGSRPLRELVKPSDTVGIVCNDITRPTPYRAMLPALLAELSHVPDEAIILLIATGTHRPNTADELRAMLGDGILERFRVVQNDARAGGSLKAGGLGDGRTDCASCYPQAAHEAAALSHELVGTTTSGNDIWIHRDYLRCDVRILTGFIEPHFFAGFSGGGKACMPGLARLETVLRNHCARNMDHPLATWGVTHGNPIWEEICEGARMTSPTFLLNVTLDRAQRITGVFAGDLEVAHEQGCAFVKQHAMVPVDAPYDIVITSNAGYPLDLNLYQAVKGMSVAARIVKEGGTVIVAADCWDGIPDYGEYKRLLFEAPGPAALLEKLRRPDCHVQDAWQAHIHARICRQTDVRLFSHNLTDEEIERAMLRPCHDIGAAVERLLRLHGRDISICVLPEGPQTIPYVRTNQES